MNKHSTSEKYLIINMRANLSGSPPKYKADQRYLKLAMLLKILKLSYLLTPLPSWGFFSILLFAFQF